MMRERGRAVGEHPEDAHMNTYTHLGSAHGRQDAAEERLAQAMPRAAEPKDSLNSRGGRDYLYGPRTATRLPESATGDRPLNVGLLHKKIKGSDGRGGSGSEGEAAEGERDTERSMREGGIVRGTAGDADVNPAVRCALACMENHWLSLRSHSSAGLVTRCWLYGQA